MQKNFNPLAEAVKNDMNKHVQNAKYCVALNYLIKMEPLQSKDSIKFFDSLVDDSLEHVTPGLLERMISDPYDDKYRMSVTKGDLSNDVFAVSLSDQLMGASMRNSIWDMQPAFEGAIAFTIDEREVDKLQKEFPSMHGTLKIFDSAEERKAFIHGVQGLCLNANRNAPEQGMHLDS